MKKKILFTVLVTMFSTFSSALGTKNGGWQVYFADGWYSFGWCQEADKPSGVRTWSGTDNSFTGQGGSFSASWTAAGYNWIPDISKGGAGFGLIKPMVKNWNVQWDGTGNIQGNGTTYTFGLKFNAANFNGYKDYNLTESYECYIITSTNKTAGQLDGTWFADVYPDGDPVGYQLRKARVNWGFGDFIQLWAFRKQNTFSGPINVQAILQAWSDKSGTSFKTDTWYIPGGVSIMNECFGSSGRFDLTNIQIPGFNTYLPLPNTGGSTGNTVTAITASSAFSEEPVTNLNDNAAATKWTATGNVPSVSSPTWAVYQYDKPYVFTIAKLTTPADETYENRSPRDFKIQGSTNGITWVDLSSQTNQEFASAELKTYTFESTTSYTYYRVLITKNNNGIIGANWEDGSKTHLGDLSFESDLPTVTTSNELTGETASNLFDGNLATKWTGENSAVISVAMPQWVAVKYSIGKTYVKYILTNAVDNLERAPKDWTFEGSNNGTTWTVLDTKVAQDFTAQTPKEYTFANTTSYTYYKLNITSTHSTDGYFGKFANLAEMSFSPVTTTDNVAPTIPAGLNSSAITATSFTLSWTASTDNVAVTGYEVFKNGVSVGTTASTSMSITGLTSGVSYSMTVKARDAVPNWSAVSTALPVITTDNVAPSIPAVLGSSAITATSFTLSWTASTDNVAVTGYEVFRNGVSVGSTASTSMNITALTSGVSYSMTVKARDAAPNWSAASTALNITTMDAKLTGTVIGTNGTWSGNSSDDKSTVFDGNTATFFDCTTADYAWAGLDLGSTYQITSIKYYPRSSFPERMINGVFEGSNSADFSSGVFVLRTITTLPSIAWLSLIVTNSSGFRYIRYKSPVGGYCNVAEVEFYGSVSTDNVAPSSPTSLSATSISSTGFSLSWTASTDNVAVTGYDVFKDGGLYSSVAATTASITGLTPGVTYQMTVKAKDAAGNASALSAAKSVQTSSNNILLNPGFENGTTSWTGQYGCTLTAGTTFHSGTMGGSVTARSYPSSSAEQTITSAIASLGGGNYYLEAWVKMASGSSTVKATFKYRYNNTDYYLGVQGVVGTTWTKLSGTVNVAYTGTLQFAQFYLETIAGTSSFFVDDCIVNIIGQLRVGKFKGEESVVNVQDNKGEDLHIYPNPVSTELNILNVDLDSRVSIFNIDGRLVKRFNSEQKELSINVSAWDKGIYFLNVQNGKQNRTSKFIVQ